ncbi:MAG: hypothetical protein HY067_14665 [Betaproteobacteria bacterium]|nr:hypothetical protein [Betaproteobacteria bacterium]
MIVEKQKECLYPAFEDHHGVDREARGQSRGARSRLASSIADNERAKTMAAKAVTQGMGFDPLNLGILCWFH